MPQPQRIQAIHLDDNSVEFKTRNFENLRRKSELGGGGANL